MSSSDSSKLAGLEIEEWAKVEKLVKEKTSADQKITELINKVQDSIVGIFTTHEQSQQVIQERKRAAHRESVRRNLEHRSAKN